MTVMAGVIGKQGHRGSFGLRSRRHHLAYNSTDYRVAKCNIQTGHRVAPALELTASVHVFPVFAVEQPGKYEEDDKKQEHISADAQPICLVGLRGVGQEVHEVIHRAIKLARRHERPQRRTAILLALLSLRWPLDLLIGTRGTTLELHQDVRHADIGIHAIIHTVGA